MKKNFVALLLAVTCASLNSEAQLKVVTSLSVYADIAQSVGGDLVETSYVAAPRFNPHFIEPRPSDVLRVKRADLFIHSGMDLEAWRGPLVDAAARAEIRGGGSRELDVSRGIPILETPDRSITRAEGDIHLFGNPHFWLDPRNGERIARTIGTKLEELDPANASRYRTNVEEYSRLLRGKIIEWQKILKPFKGRELIGYHNEWVYLMDFGGLTMSKFLEPKPGIPPTPRQIDYLISYVKEKDIRAIVQATFYSREAAESVAKRSGAKVAMLCQNVRETSDVTSYVELIDYDVRTLVEALSTERSSSKE